MKYELEKSSEPNMNKSSWIMLDLSENQVSSNPMVDNHLPQIIEWPLAWDMQTIFKQC